MFAPISNPILLMHKYKLQLSRKNMVAMCFTCVEKGVGGFGLAWTFVHKKRMLM
jgi:hypothetical protein